MLSNLRKWLKISLFNLMLVAFVGVILRYKIAYSLPFIDQKKLLHGHSHFAFAGWVTQALMALLVSCLHEITGENTIQKYRWLFVANGVAAYGMLCSFPFQGYGSVSIFFSTLSVFVSYFFAVIYWRDINRLKGNQPCRPWFKVALLGNVLSSIGPFTLAYMMISRSMEQNDYLASIYFFLHFQYNVWFFFSCMGLLIYRFGKLNIPGASLKRVYRLFTFSCVPAYFLSVLWWPLPRWLYILVVIATICQLTGWFILVRFIRMNRVQIKNQMGGFPAFLFLLSGIALTIKLSLQTGSVIPSLSNLAFGFRPIVIGYLHLVLLGVITIFILAYMVNYRLIAGNRISKAGIIIFISGIFGNEFLLMVQGVSDLLYAGVPFINQLLLIAAVILFAGMFITVYGQFFRKDDLDHKTQTYTY